MQAYKCNACSLLLQLVEVPSLIAVTNGSALKTAWLLLQPRACFDASSGYRWPRVTIQSPRVPLRGAGVHKGTCAADGAPAAGVQEQEQDSFSHAAQCSAREKPVKHCLQKVCGCLLACCGTSAVVCMRGWCS